MLGYEIRAIRNFVGQNFASSGTYTYGRIREDDKQYREREEYKQELSSSHNSMMAGLPGVAGKT